MTPSPGFYRLARTVLVCFARVFWRVRIEGRERLPASGAYVLAPVHRSNVDFLMAACLTGRRIRFMGKDTLWKVPVLRTLIDLLGAFPVHRDAPDRQALRRCVAVLAGGEPLVVFPEGARQSGPLVKELYEGAAYLGVRAGVPVVPVGIGGSAAAMPKGSKGLRPVRVAVVVGRPLYPARAPDGRRPPRSAVRELTERLHGDLQELFDRAQVRAGG